MLNPEGYRHAPASKDGCILFVKLRQHGGDDRKHKRLDTAAMPWEPVDDKVSRKILYEDSRHDEASQWSIGESRPTSTSALLRISCWKSSFFADAPLRLTRAASCENGVGFEFRRKMS
eukprot:TRINITY_DN10851_c0_g1_i1.p1 TRINITY_DN10851_c0_g1~~TRINITY_DN10851_c0_g1_i1.p1  ORF type:complete len:118 (+),score=7.92 TRINITY_DN10851_c0_g1_i1:246-599(+)